MGYAPGVRIQLKDNSGYSVVENPNTVAGIVGYASKGELNKIIQVANTGELGVKLGYGYQSYKYNQGMYAANAVLTAGGEVEFVRPYGEEISRTDAYKRDLKTDCFVVAYDKNAALYTDIPRTSLNIKHFASTRFKTDGAAEFGVTRKINNISETVATGKNVEFNVDASENFADSAASRKYEMDGNTLCTDMVMFAVMNRDPSNAYRAYDRYEVVNWSNRTTNRLTCTIASKPAFVIGDMVYLPDTENKTDKGTSGSFAEAVVVDIEDKAVTLEVSGKYADYFNTNNNRPDVILFSDAANAIADGFDYINIKTAVAGNSVKNFSVIKMGVKDKTPSEEVVTGTMLTFYAKNRGKYFVRLWGGKAPTEFSNVVATQDDTNNVTLAGITEDIVIEGDVLLLEVGLNKAELVVKKFDDNGNAVCSCDAVISGTGTLSFKSFADAKESGVFVADVSPIMTEAESNTWDFVAGKVATAIQTNLSYSRVATVNDIKQDADGNNLVSGTEIKIDPSAAYDYSIGDLVGIVRNANDFTDYADAAKVSCDGKVYTVTAINTMSGTITVNAKEDLSLEKDVKFQLINFTSTNSTLYTAKSTYKYSHSVPVEESNVTVTVVNASKVLSGLSVVANDVVTLYNEATPTDTYTFTVTGSDGSGTTTIAKTTTFDTAKIGNTDPTTGTYTVTVTDASQTITSANLAAHLAVGDTITLTKTTTDEQQQPVTTTTQFVVSEIDGSVISGTGVSETTTFDSASYSYTKVEDRDVADIYMVSSYTMYVSKVDQKKEIFEPSRLYIDTLFVAEVDKSDVVLADSDIGASFMALGLAKTKYVDINYDGNPLQVFTLTDEGIEIARMFMAVRYRFNGTLYEFEGTVAPYNLNGRQLSIQEAADYELENSGLEFVMNDSGVLDYFLENNSYDLSQTIIDGVLNGSSTAISFNEDDPAIVNDAVWTYSPLNNNSGSTLTTVWSLFVNKDSSDVDMLVAAGMAINSPFTRKYETLNTQVMQAMLNVCEARKDCFAIFDGINEPDINKAVKELVRADGFGSTHGRWGFLYDGRGVFQDSIYTNSQVEVMKSVQLASIITANRQSGIFWIPAAGDEAYVPSAWGSKEKFVRSYNSEDKNCDHAKLSDIHANATRVNRDGIRIWGDWTLQMEDTAFNQMHVTMLVAGIHKMFYKYLDHKVFKLNTTTLRSQITSDLQDKLNMIIRQNPQGLINGTVICDDTNNTPEIIDQNYLIVDLKLLPPKTTRWIILRTTVESTKNGKNISTTIVSE